MSEGYLVLRVWGALKVVSWAAIVMNEESKPIKFRSGVVEGVAIKKALKSCIKESLSMSSKVTQWNFQPEVYDIVKDISTQFEFVQARMQNPIMVKIHNKVSRQVLVTHLLDTAHPVDMKGTKVIVEPIEPVPDDSKHLLWCPFCFKWVKTTHGKTAKALTCCGISVREYYVKRANHTWQ